MKLSQRLRELREKHHYSQTEIANLLNVTRQAVSKWENDQSKPELEKLEILAHLYGLSMQDLLEPEIKAKKKRNDWFLIGLCWIGFIVCMMGGSMLRSQNTVVVEPPLNPNNPKGIVMVKEMELVNEFNEKEARELIDEIPAVYNEGLTSFMAYEVREDILRCKAEIDYHDEFYFGFVSEPGGEYFHYESDYYEAGKYTLIFDVDVSEIKGKDIDCIVSIIDSNKNSRAFFGDFSSYLIEELCDGS